MGEWCTRQHGASGLTERCLAATQAMGEVESEVCAYVSKHFPDGRAIIAGSSVHADKAFIRKDVRAPLSALADRSDAPSARSAVSVHYAEASAYERRHYRIIDVSVLRELGARWYPELRDRPDRHESDHRALSDIKQSMAGAADVHVAVSLTPADLRHLRGSMFVPPS